ncbi:aldehyde dehydrogenase family protein [Corynebacterium variabile]|uniref:aldehyde dehydrogenase family protein n=2 Tax=Corynebacterium variabile TaxID=1727 RepID=UPI0028AE2330|nr:aldehyde dehydrogenase family protein [Corynebacterium variabile]
MTELPTLPTTVDELLSTVTVPLERRPDGDVVSSRAVHDPATGQVIGLAPVHGAEEVDEAVAVARDIQPEWASWSPAERAAVLNRAADAVDAVAGPLAELLSRETGKPLNGPNARFEVGACSAWLRTAASLEVPEETVVDDVDDRASGGTRATLTWRPVGIVGAIGPWNWPMMISIWQIAPALRMGNAVIVKPSENTTLSVLALGWVLNQVLPAGVLTVVPGEREVGSVIAGHPDIRKVMFTGSTATGRRIVEASAGNLKRLTLELGGNDAGIVLPDIFDGASPERRREIAETLFWGAFINTGQTCAALKRLYVPDEIYDEVCRALVRVAENVPMGMGLEEENLLGPLQNRTQFDIVDRLVEDAKASGATVLCGGNPDRDAPGNFYPTTLVADIDGDAALVTEEQFGPALPIIRYTDLDDAVAEANRSEAGLGGSVWSADPVAAREVAARLEAGTVWINNHGAVDPRIPFGGVKGSGYGLEFGVEGLKAVAVPQVING